jgi:hypothetical protein
MQNIDKMLTYSIYFNVALFPEGFNGVEYISSIGRERDDKIFKRYLCQETESQKIIEYLYSIYKDYPNGEDIYDLKYIDNGMFKCKIIAENDNGQDDIQDILWPYEIVNKYVFIDEKNRSIVLLVDTFYEDEEDKHEEDEDEEDECNKVGDCEFCGENDVEYRCINCENKVCYPCRSRCSECMNTICPTCNKDNEICDYCIENINLLDDEEEEEEEEEEEDQHIYNGGYYHDAMDMEAQMTEDVKLREAWAKLKNQT